MDCREPGMPRTLQSQCQRVSQGLWRRPLRLRLRSRCIVSPSVSVTLHSIYTVSFGVHYYVPCCSCQTGVFKLNAVIPLSVTDGFRCRLSPRSSQEFRIKQQILI